MRGGIWSVPPNFNPRSREGSDYLSMTGDGQTGYFNPRSREGSDGGAIARVVARKTISIHAPVKGATRDWWLHPRSDPYFNPRSREGSD